jgi:hypothetical protein
VRIFDAATAGPTIGAEELLIGVVYLREGGNMYGTWLGIKEVHIGKLEPTEP